jgi:hypothetical protein
MSFVIAMAQQTKEIHQCLEKKEALPAWFWTDLFDSSKLPELLYFVFPEGGPNLLICKRPNRCK